MIEVIHNCTDFTLFYYTQLFDVLNSLLARLVAALVVSETPNLCSLNSFKRRVRIAGSLSAFAHLLRLIVLNVIHRSVNMPYSSIMSAQIIQNAVSSSRHNENMYSSITVRAWFLSAHSHGLLSDCTEKNPGLFVAINNKLRFVK